MVEGTNQGPVVRLRRRVAGLDARRVRLHRLPADHASDRTDVRRVDDRRDLRLHHHAVDAAGGRHRVRLARRSDGPQEAADDRDPRLFAVQLRRRLLAHLPVPVLRPRACSACSWAPSGPPVRALAMETLAAALARVHGRQCCKARGASASCCRSRSTGCSTTRSAGAACCGSACCPPSRSLYVRFFVKEPEVWTGKPAHPAHPAPRGQGPAHQHLQARHDPQHAERLLVHGERLRALLLDQRAVRDASAGRPEACRREPSARSAWPPTWSSSWPARAGAGSPTGTAARWRRSCRR